MVEQTAMIELANENLLKQLLKNLHKPTAYLKRPVESTQKIA